MMDSETFGKNESIVSHLMQYSNFNCVIIIIIGDNILLKE